MLYVVSPQRLEKFLACQTDASTNIRKQNRVAGRWCQAQLTLAKSGVHPGSVAITGLVYRDTFTFTRYLEWPINLTCKSLDDDRVDQLRDPVCFCPPRNQNSDTSAHPNTLTFTYSHFDLDTTITWSRKTWQSNSSVVTAVKNEIFLPNYFLNMSYHFPIYRY